MVLFDRRWIFRIFMAFLFDGYHYFNYFMQKVKRYWFRALDSHFTSAYDGDIEFENFSLTFFEGFLEWKRMSGG